MDSGSRLKALCVAINVALLTAPTVGLAQAVAEDGSRRERRLVVEEVIVSAQKREENIQDVPMTIMAIGREGLENRQIESLTDLGSQVPSLVVGSQYGTTFISLRGISTSLTSGTEDPSVATHINGIYQPRSRSIDSAMVDLERVEVLSGPQGTLYGRNATGGVVNYILRGPSAEFEGEITGRIANYDRLGLKGSFSGPITDDIGVRVSGIYDDQREGFTDNLSSEGPDTLDRARVKGGRVALSYSPLDNLQIDLDSYYLDSKATAIFNAYGPSQNPSKASLLGAQSYEPHEIFSNSDGMLSSRTMQTSATVTWDTSDSVTVKSLTGYQRFSHDMTLDIDASGTSLVMDPLQQSQKTETFTQEFNLTAQSFNDRLVSIIGAFYFDDSVSQEARFTLRGASPSTVMPAGDQDSKSYAVYTDQTFSITDDVRLIAGVRYNRDEKEGTFSQFVNGNLTCPFVSGDLSWSKTTPRAGIQVDVSDNAMVYGQWSKGFKSGGFAANTCANQYEPEEISGGEIGLKSSVLDSRVQFNLAGYYYDYDDLQVQQNVGVGFRVTNAAAARIYGAEISLQAVITDSLRVDLSGMRQSARYVDFQNCDSSAFSGACSATDPRPSPDRLVDITGNWLNRAAPYSVTLGVEYDLLLAGGGSLLLRAESFHSGKVHYNEFATALGTQKAYDLQNLYLTFTPASDSYALRAFAKNVLDEEYKVSSTYQTITDQQTGNWGAPRTFGAELTFRF